MGKNISRPKQVTDWVARLEKLEQMLAAESGSSLHVQPAWTDKNVLARLLRHQITGPENPGLPLSGSPPTRGRPRLGGASAVISRLKADEFRALRGVCVEQYHRGIASTCP